MPKEKTKYIYAHFLFVLSSFCLTEFSQLLKLIRYNITNLFFQACIDDNLDIVEFLVDHGADVDVCDNEGWTPLHATASCGFTEIAR